MSKPPCCFCGKLENPDSRFSQPSLWDHDTGKIAHYECFVEKQDELTHNLEFEPCCDDMMHVAGYKIQADPFTESFAVYDPDNEFKYYFSNIRFCPFCGVKIK